MRREVGFMLVGEVGHEHIAADIVEDVAHMAVVTLGTCPCIRVTSGNVCVVVADVEVEFGNKLLDKSV